MARAPERPTVEQLITGGLPLPTGVDEVIRGGAPSADQAFGDLAGLNGASLGTFDLDQLYSENVQKVLGLGIGYSQNPADAYEGFLKPIAAPTGRDWVSAYYADPVSWNIALRLSGYYRGKDDPRLGLKSDSYVTSFGQLLTDAALSGKTITEMLQGTPKGYAELVKSGKVNLSALGKRGRGGGGGPTRAPLRIEVTDPEDLKQVARATALDTIGYVPDDNFLGEFVKLYQGMQSGYQRKAYSAAVSGGKVTQPGSAQTVAENELQEDYATEAGAYSTVKAFDSFLSIIGAQQGVAGGQ